VSMDVPLSTWENLSLETAERAGQDTMGPRVDRLLLLQVVPEPALAVDRSSTYC
jgi:hypothetical protein